MALITKIGKLETEELQMLRSLAARENGYKLHPEAYSAAEIENNEMRGFQITAGLLAKYDVDVSRDWRISNYTGDIWYED